MTVEQTIRFAANAHKGQVDKNGDSYFLHPLAVSDAFSDPTRKKIALLHDVLEDTEVTEPQLRRLFQRTIVDAVVALTKRKGEPNEDYYARVKANRMAMEVKIADVEHNVSRIHRLQDEAVRTRLTAKYQKAMVILKAAERSIKP
jgi:(p)ppGpp synthase/HD superfamily hydrolase